MSTVEFAANAAKRIAKAARRKTSERTHEDAVAQWCLENGIWCVRLVFLYGVGWPDRTLFCPGGKIIFLEMKKDTTSSMSTGQRRVRLKLKSLGFTFLLGYGSDDAIAKVKRKLKL